MELRAVFQFEYYVYRDCDIESWRSIVFVGRYLELSLSIYIECIRLGIYCFLIE